MCYYHKWIKITNNHRKTCHIKNMWFFKNNLLLNNQKVWKKSQEKLQNTIR